MMRTAIVSTLLLAWMATTVGAQVVSPSSGRAFGEKLDQFRRSLLGDSLGSEPQPSQASAPRISAPNSSAASQPRGVFVELSQRDNKTESEPTRNPSTSGPPTGRTMTPGRSTVSSSPAVAAPRVGSPTLPPANASRTAASPTNVNPTPTNVAPPALQAPTQRVESVASRPVAAPIQSASPPNNTRQANTTPPANNLRRPIDPSEPVLGTRESEPLRNDISADSSSRVQRTAPARSLINPLHDASTSVAPAAAQTQVLVARRSPNLSVEATGPRKITVGKEALYSVRARNAGDSPASEVVVHVAIPSWAEVVEARATSGSTSTPGDGSTGLDWKLSNLQAQGQDELVLKIIPRRSEAFDLGLRYSYAPALTTTTVEVQEPRLEMHVSGPKDVIFGQQHNYKLTISNPGTGDAENVVVNLLPINPGDNSVARHNLGTLPAGASRTLEIELTARQAGQITIRTDATADAGLTASAVEQVWVRRAGLDVAITGPATHYAGVPATYEIRVRNPGDAEAQKVSVSAMLPSDAELLSATSGAERATGGRQATWNIERLAPGGEQVFTVKCAMRSGGENRVEATATAANDLRATNLVATQVIAVADLVLEVNDSAGPVPIGQDTIYEVKVRNRGTSSADGVEMVVFFSNGVEPTSVEGGLHEISPGTVLFRGIPSLAAGSEVTYKVHAKAEAAGSHRIRVELQCRTLGTKLTQEDSTLFYGDEPAQVAREPQKPAIQGGDRY